MFVIRCLPVVLFILDEVKNTNNWLIIQLSQTLDLLVGKTPANKATRLKIY